MSTIIIGSGFAGAACAWWLARLGAKDIVVLEREEMPGVHSSGLNAGLARRYEEDKTLAPLASEGVDFIITPPKGFVDKPIIEQNGSLLINSQPVPDCKFHKVISKKEAIKIVPILATATFENGLLTETDGIVDIHTYLWAFINGAKASGVKFLMSREIKKFQISKHTSQIETIETNKETFKADIVVNASGAWIQQIADMVGAEKLSIKPFRRHLYCTPVMPEVDPKWPMVWDVKHQYYFRPESHGLLLGACDEEEVPPSAPCLNPKIRENLAEKLTNFCPALSNISIAREWCACRTFAPDKRPVIRFDNKIKNFFWLGALGGRGMTCASSAGRIASEEIIKRLKNGS